MLLLPLFHADGLSLVAVASPHAIRRCHFATLFAALLMLLMLRRWRHAACRLPHAMSCFADYGKIQRLYCYAYAYDATPLPAFHFIFSDDFDVFAIGITPMICCRCCRLR